MSIFARLRGPLLPGALFALFYSIGSPGYGVPGVPFLALIPFIHLATGASSARFAFIRGFLAGTAASIPLYYWIAWTVAVPGNLGWILGGTAAFLVSSLVALYLGISAWAAHRLSVRFGSNGLYAFPAVWTAVELLRSILFTGFPWLLLGTFVVDSRVLRQAADLAGLFGIAFILILVNVGFWRFVTEWSAGRRRGAVVHLSAALLVVGAWCGYGFFRVSQGTVPAGPAVKVGIAQGGIDQNMKWDPKYQQETMRIYADLTDSIKRDYEVSAIVWPETAAPFFYGWEEGLTGVVDNIAKAAGVPLVFGAPWYDPADGGRFYNSVFLLNVRGTIAGRYDKRRLVPFGEYIPMKPILSFIKKLTPGGEDFSAGTSVKPFLINGSKAAVSVCYEAVFPTVIRESVDAGGEWFVNVTNDSWFGDTVAPEQHLAMARMRCVEFGRPMVRAANAGISAIIDEKGDVVASLGFGRAGILVGAVVPSRERTAYADSGETFPILCAIFSLFILILPSKRA